jgi:hypothetical protein
MPAPVVAPGSALLALVPALPELPALLELPALPELDWS